MHFLLNTERVLLEVVELARLRISRELGLPPEKVSVRLSLEGGKVAPCFDVDSDISELEVQSAIKTIWGQLLKELSTRINGLGDRRVTGN